MIKAYFHQKRERFCSLYLNENSKTSSILGMEGAAPGLDIAIPAALAAVSIACSTVSPRKMPAIKKPEKVSPAAVVSTTSVL